MNQKLLIALAVLLIVGGGWWQFQGRHSNTPNNATPATDIAGPATPTQEDIFTNPENQESSNEADPDVTVDVESLATDDELETCIPTENGFGVEMKDWGVVRIPYASTWPKNEPGTPVDCAPETDFGAAITAAHSLYLDTFKPELIPVIAADTPGRQLRIDSHPGGFNPEQGELRCEMLGWNKPIEQSSIYHIYQQCDGSSIEVGRVRMRYAEGAWLMVHEIDGRMRVENAEPGAEYFPFDGGD